MAKPDKEKLEKTKQLLKVNQSGAVAAALAENEGATVRQEITENEAEGSITIKTFIE